MGQTIINKQPWWQLLSIQTGGTICLPVIMIGQLVCQKYGFYNACWSIALGNLFLLIISYLLASLSAYRPQSTIEHTSIYFGKYGRLLFAMVVIISMLGWFGIQINVMTLSCEKVCILLGIPYDIFFFNVGIGIIISCLMCLGMRALKGISYLTVPLLAFTLFYATLSHQDFSQTVITPTISYLGGVSLIIGVNITAVIDLPTYLQHARSAKDGKVCTLILYGIVVPFIEFVGVYLSKGSEQNSIVDVLLFRHGTLWMLWICCFILLSGWATNNANLYSSIISSYSLVSRLNPLTRTLLLGAIGTFVACFNPLGKLEELLDLLGIMIGGMGAVIIGNYLIEAYHPKYKIIAWISFLSWLTGVILGILSMIIPTLTATVPACDAFIISFIIQISSQLIYFKEPIYETIEY